MAPVDSATDPVPILEALVRCPSVTPDEGGALTYLQKLLTPLGFTCHRLTFSEAGTPDVDNLFARIGIKGPHLCFAGHTDVVPPGNIADWTHPPFAATIADGYLFGRGATDMKGSVAAFTAAMIDAAKDFNGTLPGSISLLITSDEEGPAINGTVKVLSWMKEHNHIPDHCIVGEPSSSEILGDTIKIGRRGSLSAVVTVEGKQGHVAYPHKADNPIPRLARFLDRISSAKLDDGNDRFDPSTLAITTIDVGNPAGNVIPARATAKFNIRFNTEHDFDSLESRIRQLVAEVADELGDGFTLTFTRGADSFITAPGPFVGVVQDAVFQESGVMPKLSTSGGSSDARFVKNYCPVLEFGPTNATIHQVDERISIEELRATSRIYRSIIDAYFRHHGA